MGRTVKTPIVPGYVRIDGYHRALAELTEEEMTAMAEDWCERLKKKRLHQRNATK